ncbi:MAG: hypothetical protein U9P72_02755 [Campylobacterota bacterium]|nr:hypothetical protein [Campylobacterota bacterium]
MINDEILFIIDENKQLLFNGTEFKDAPSKNKKEYFSATSLPSSLIYTHGFKTAKTTSDDKIEIQAEMKMFDEAGLNPDVDFKIASKTIPLEDSDDNYIEIFASEITKIDDIFESIAKKNHHIDAIFPPSLSYRSLYSFELLDKKNDLFIHFGDDNSYAVIFKNGQYISTRSISSINELAKHANIELSQMKELLCKKGVKNSLYSEDEFLLMGNIEDQLSKIVEKISHSIGHKRGVFKLDSIDRIFLDFETADIPGFLNLFNNYGYEDASKEILNIFDSVEVGMKHYALNALYALGSVQDKYSIVNLTIYERKPAFLKTNVGHLSIITLFALILSSVYPVYTFLELEKLNASKAKLKNDISKIQNATKKLQTTLKKERDNRDELRKEKTRYIREITSYDHLLTALQSFRNETLFRQKIMKDVNMAMKKYKLSSKHLEFNNPGSITVQIITDYDKRDNITKFIKDLITQGYSHVETKKVEKKENYYESFVEISR